MTSNLRALSYSPWVLGSQPQQSRVVWHRFATTRTQFLLTWKASLTQSADQRYSVLLTGTLYQWRSLISSGQWTRTRVYGELLSSSSTIIVGRKGCLISPFLSDLIIDKVMEDVLGIQDASVKPENGEKLWPWITWTVVFCRIRISASIQSHHIPWVGSHDILFSSRSCRSTLWVSWVFIIFKATRTFERKAATNGAYSDGWCEMMVMTKQPKEVSQLKVWWSHEQFLCMFVLVSFTFRSQMDASVEGPTNDRVEQVKHGNQLCHAGDLINHKTGNGGNANIWKTLTDCGIGHILPWQLYSCLFILT